MGQTKEKWFLQNYIHIFDYLCRQITNNGSCPVIYQQITNNGNRPVIYQQITNSGNRPVIYQQIPFAYDKREQ